jgi:hypothetical protein
VLEDVGGGDDDIQKELDEAGGSADVDRELAALKAQIGSGAAEPSASLPPGAAPGSNGSPGSAPGSDNGAPASDGGNG